MSFPRLNGERVVSLALLCAVCTPPVWAEAVLKDTVVTATMSEHETRTAPASVTVVTRDQIEKSNASNLLDVVRGSPGITLSPRQVGGRKTLALRGLEGKHTLTLIDGRRIAPTDDVVGHSDYQYGWLPVSAIERVEIIRGPMSTLYGSEALGGVVNLITRQPKDKWIGSLMLTGDELLEGEGGDGYRASAFVAGPLGERVSLRLNAASSARDPIPDRKDARYSEIEGSETDGFGIGGIVKVSDAQTIDLQWNKGDDIRRYDDVDRYGTNYENRYDIVREQLSLTWNGDFARWRSQLRAYQSEIDITNRRTKSVAATRPQNMRDEIVDGFAAIRFGAQTLTFGGEYRTETLKNAGLVNGKDSARHQALFVQDELSLASNLVLTAGIRGDDHEIFGTEASPRAYLVWEATPELVIKGGYGHAFKAPTLKQISPSYVGAEGPHTFLGNANVRPESSDSLEISADWQRGPLNLRATVFGTKVDDLITYRLIKVEGPRRTYRYDNVNEASIIGLESGFSWMLTPALSWETNLTWLSTEDKSTGKELADRPEIAVASQVDWQLGDAWSARGAVEYYGHQYDTTRVRLPTYAIWNFSIGKMITKHVSLRAGLNNISDVNLAEKSPNFGYAEMGRNAFVTLRAEL